MHTACVWSEKNYRLQNIQLSKSQSESNVISDLRCQIEDVDLRSSIFNLENLVENTGLEPVTSWLQTRRSPS